jgi:CubicO group peptidase (beta-lactamase class C family)
LKNVIIVLLLSIASLGNAGELQDKIDSIVKQYVAEVAFQGNVLVTKNNQKIFEGSYGFANSEFNILNSNVTKFRIASLSKQFTAAGILLLQEDGKLNVQDLLSKHISVPDAWKDISIHHVLTHTAGLQRDIPLNESLYSQYHPLKGLVASVQQVPLMKGSVVGKSFSYSNAGYSVLAYMIEKISGLPYGAFLKKKIFEPAGMFSTSDDHDSEIVKDRAHGYISVEGQLFNACCFDLSNIVGAGSILSSTNDLAIWDQTLQTTKLLSQKSLDALFSPHVKDPNAPRYWGYGWVIDQFKGNKLIWHNGALNGFLSDFAHFTDSNVTIIILSNRQDNPSKISLGQMRTEIANTVISK